MGINLSGGMAAGQGADALESLLSRLFAEGQAKIRNQQVQQGIDQENKRLEMAAADRAAAQADLAKARSVQNAGRIAGNLRIGQTITQPTIDALKSGDMGDLVEHQQENLASRAITQAPITGTLRMGDLKAGAPERDIFTGTAEQHEAEAARTDRQAALHERQVQAEQARQDRIAAAKQAQIDREELQRQRAEDQANQARLVASLRPPSTTATNQSNTLAMKLADDYTRDAKDFTTQNATIRRIEASAKDPSAAGDMALLYGYMKMLDPNSVVRESEFATAAKSGSLPQQIQGYAMKVANGQRLTPEQRADFLNRARALYGEAKATNTTVRDSYTKRAQKFGVDPSLVFTDIEEQAAPPPGGGGGGRVYYDANGNPIKR